MWSIFANLYTTNIEITEFGYEKLSAIAILRSISMVVQLECTSTKFFVNPKKALLTLRC